MRNNIVANQEQCSPNNIVASWIQQLLILAVYYRYHLQCGHEMRKIFQPARCRYSNTTNISLPNLARWRWQNTEIVMFDKERIEELRIPESARPVEIHKRESFEILNLLRPSLVLVLSCKNCTRKNLPACSKWTRQQAAELTSILRFSISSRDPL